MMIRAFRQLSEGENSTFYQWKRRMRMSRKESPTYSWAKGVEENIVNILVYQREESCKNFIFATKQKISCLNQFEIEIWSATNQWADYPIWDCQRDVE